MKQSKAVALTKDLSDLTKVVAAFGPRQLRTIRFVHRIMTSYARGYIASCVISALRNVGFFEALDREGTVNVMRFSEKYSYDGFSLRVLCEYLYTIGLLNKTQQGYKWSHKGHATYHLGYGVFDLLHAYAPIFENLEPIIKSEKLYGSDIFRRSKFVASGSAGIARFLPFPVAKKILRGANAKHVLDLGCGNGEFLVDTCRELQIFGIGIDTSAEAIADAIQLAKRTGVTDLVQFEQADIFDVSAIAKKFPGVDYVTSMFVLHEFIPRGTSYVIELLSSIRSAFPHAKLLICELGKRYSKILRQNPTALAEHHCLHAISNQGVISSRQWKRILSRAEYLVTDEICFNFAAQLYFVANPS